MSRDRRRPTRRRRWPWILGGLAVFVLIVGSCAGNTTAPNPGVTGAPAALNPPPPPQATSIPTRAARSSSNDDTTDPTTSDTSDMVTLEVTGHGVSKATNISFGSLTGGQAQHNGKSLPWRTRIPAGGGFNSVSLTAQSGSGGSGSITCTIRQGDQVIQTNTSEGAYAVVMCSGAPS